MSTIINITPSQDLQATINNCSNPSVSNQYDIVLAEGTYNVMNLRTRDYVNIKGATTDRSKYWIKGERPNGSNNCSSYETITFKTTTILENLTITCKNMRYPYHNDNVAVNAYQTVKNCHIEHLGNWKADGITPAPYSESGWDSCHANGCGTSSGMTLDISNSTLIARQNGMALYAHNAPNMTSASHIIATNNTLIHADGGSAVFMDGGNVNPEKDTLVLINNKMQGAVFGRNWAMSGSNNDYEFFYDAWLTPSNIYFGTEHYKHLSNNSGVTISRGMACAFNNDQNNIKPMTSTDSISSFAGIASQDIVNGNMGYVAFKGKVLSNELVLPSGLVKGDKLGIDPSTPGRFIKSSANYVLTYSEDWISYGTNKGKLLTIGISGLETIKFGSVKVDGVLREITSIRVKSNLNWRNMDKIYVKVGGSWKSQ